MKVIWRVFVPVMLVVATVSCMQSNADYDVLASRNLQCPEGSHLEYLPWGKSGLRAVCLMEHGPIVIAENGRVVIEGQHMMGKKVGEWRWLDASGKVARAERPDGGKP